MSSKKETVSPEVKTLIANLRLAINALADKCPHFKGCGFYHAKQCDCALLKARILSREAGEI